MNNVIYIATIGSTGKEKKPNFGPLNTGLFNFTAQSIFKIHIISDIENKTLLNSFFDTFPYFKEKTLNHQTNIFDYESVIEIILSIYKSYEQEGNRFVINITGGTKMMTLGAFMGGTLIGAEFHYIKEAKSKPEETQILDIFMPKIPIYKLHDLQKLILMILNLIPETNKNPTQSDIRKKINSEYVGGKVRNIQLQKKVSPQIMSYHCEILENNDLIKRTHDEKNKRAHILSLTRIGKIIANFIFEK